MADRDFTSVMFALEKKVVHLGFHITFGANGAPTIDTPNSLGLLQVTQFTKSFTATAASTASYTAVSDFTDLYNGMIISGTNVAAGSVISALNAAAGTFTSSLASTGVVSAVTATGGYVIQLGKKLLNGNSLDTYPKLLGIDIMPDCSGLIGAASTQASTPAGPTWFMIGNTINSATVTTGASITLMCGTVNGAGATFKSVQPALGEGIYVRLMLGNSTAK
jgi:hypothetical protein